jgi:hypothetical protein
MFDILGNIWDTAYAWIGIILSAGIWLIFPEVAMMKVLAFIVVLILLDLITKLYSLGVMAGGIRKAILRGLIQDKKLWKATLNKLVTYTILTLLLSLSLWVVPIASLITPIIGGFFGLIFIREAISILRNLLNSGFAQVSWLYSFLGHKAEEIHCTEPECPNAGKEVMEACYQNCSRRGTLSCPYYVSLVNKSNQKPIEKDDEK